MKKTILFLAIIFLLISFWGCKKELPTGTSLPILVEPEPISILVAVIKEIKINVFVDFTDNSLIPFLNPIYFDHEVNVSIHLNLWPEALVSKYFRGTGIITEELSKFYGTSPGGYVNLNENQTIDSRYFVARIPPTEQEKIRWRFQIAIELNDPQYKVKIWVGEKEGFDTDWFDGWKATSSIGEPWPPLKNLFTFLIYK